MVNNMVYTPFHTKSRKKLAAFQHHQHFSGKYCGKLTAARQKPFALHFLAGQFTGAADSFGFFPSALLRWLFIMRAQLHFTENTFPLHFLLKCPEGLINIVVANDDLHLFSVSFQFDP